jgi:hypothetical protein
MRPELARATGVAARLRHGIQARGGEPGKLLERLDDQQVIGIDDRGLAGAFGLGQTRLREHTIDTGVVNTQLRGNGIHPQCSTK